MDHGLAIWANSKDLARSLKMSTHRVFGLVTQFGMKLPGAYLDAATAGKEAERKSHASLYTLSVFEEVVECDHYVVKRISNLGPIDDFETMEAARGHAKHMNRHGEKYVAIAYPKW